MSLQSDAFQIFLPSNLKGNPLNKPSLYETKLEKPFDLPGEFDVAMINIVYPHTWINLDKTYQYFLLRLPNGIDSEFAPENEKDQTDINDFILTLAKFQGLVGDCATQIPQGNFNISKILELIES